MANQADPRPEARKEGWMAFFSQFLPGNRFPATSQYRVNTPEYAAWWGGNRAASLADYNRNVAGGELPPAAEWGKPLPYQE